MKECGEQSESFINARVQLPSTEGASLWGHASSIVLNMKIFAPQEQNKIFETVVFLQKFYPRGIKNNLALWAQEV